MLQPGGSAGLGVRIQQVPLGPRLEQHSQRAGGEGGAPPARSHSSPRVSLRSDVWGPLGRAHFFLCKTARTPHCALPSVHLGLFLGQLLCQGLMAWELVKGPPVPIAPPLPPLPPPTPTVPAPASNCSHCTPRFPRAQVPRARCERHVSLQLVRRSQLVWLLLEPLSPTKLLLLCFPASALCTLTLPLSTDMGVHGR